MIKIVVIYADVLYFLLFMADYVLLKLVALIMKKKTKEVRVLLGAFLGSGLSCGAMLLLGTHTVYAFLMLLLVGSIMLKISFSIQNGKDFLRCFSLLFLCSFCMGGVCGLINRFTFFRRWTGKSIFLIGMLWFGYLFIRKGFELMKEFVLHRSQRADVCLKIQGKEAYCKGFWDSGNSLKDPITGKAVVLLEKAIMEKYQIPIPVKGFRVIPFHSVGMENGVLKGFVADELLIKDENGFEQSFQKTIVAIYEGKLSMKEDYQIILNPHL